MRTRAFFTLLAAFAAAGTPVAIAVAARTGDAPALVSLALPPAMPAGAAAALPAETAAQDYPWLPYDGSFTFARIRYQAGGGSGFRRGRGFGGDPGWRHDYPDAERNFSKIVQELTLARARQSEYGGNILTLDDPRLFLFPIAYMSEPGFWVPNEKEAEGLRNYLLKGGFIFFDDFAQGAMYNLASQMARIFPELQFVAVDGSEQIFDSFFKIDPATIELPSYRGYQPRWYVIYEDNDPEKRILAVAGDQADLGEFWEYSDRGFFPIDLSNEAYKVGVNYLIYALTH